MIMSPKTITMMKMIRTLLTLFWLVRSLKKINLPKVSQPKLISGLFKNLLISMVSHPMRDLLKMRSIKMIREPQKTQQPSKMKPQLPHTKPSKEGSTELEP